MTDRLKTLVNFVAGTVGVLVGTVVGCALVVSTFVGTGLAVGRALDLVQGAQPRLLGDWTVMIDGWAVLFALYVMLWLPLSAVARTVRAPPGLEVDLEE
jgi:hypothetical protein